jgi:hypothetical protein
VLEDWLQRLIESIDNPVIMLQSQGTLPDKPSDAPLVLEVCLHLTQAPDLLQLRRWLNQHDDQLIAASMKSIKRSTGILTFMLGLMWLH